MRIGVKKKIGTVTWITYYNFGTFLQAYALQQVVTNLGFDNFIISDESIVNQKRPKRSIYFCLKCALYRIYKRTFHNNSYAKGSCRSNILYKQFADSFLTIDRTWKDSDDLNQRYDMFICGSDQIWYPSAEIFHPFYYLAFTDKKKIAYAPSVGSSNYPEEFKSKVKSLLESFSSISVREEKGADLLRSFVSKEITVALDPTLLLSSEQWENIIHRSTATEPYILCYLLTYNQAYIDYVCSYAKEEKMQLRIFITNDKYLSYADKPLFAGPKEFLEEIHGASYFFTDSFHGTIFSIQYRKRFVTFKRFKETDGKNQNSRLTNLFAILGLEDYFISEERLSAIAQLPEIEYNCVHAILNEEREKSIIFLSKALNS